jgi:hypothetical protein
MEVYHYKLFFQNYRVTPKHANNKLHIQCNLIAYHRQIKYPHQLIDTAKATLATFKTLHICKKLYCHLQKMANEYSSLLMKVMSSAKINKSNITIAGMGNFKCANSNAIIKLILMS